MLSILHLSKSFKLTWCWASIFARTISITFSSWNDWKTFDDSIIFWNGLEAIFFNSYVKPLLWISWHGPWWPCCSLWLLPPLLIKRSHYVKLKTCFCFHLTFKKLSLIGYITKLSKSKTTTRWSSSMTMHISHLIMLYLPLSSVVENLESIQNR